MEECPSCPEEFDNEHGLAIHHKKVHGESLPNCECKICGDEFYHEKSDRLRCPECQEKGVKKPKPEDVETPEPWHELSSQQRSYYRNRSKYISDAGERRQDRVEFVRRLKSERGCSECGYDEHAVALDFHHTGDKEETIAQMAHNGCSDETILEEVEECIVLCANCHRVRHRGS